MHQLLLLRHAKSSWDDPGAVDHDRPLNPRGRHAAAAIATAMRGLRLVPDMVLVSSARRTLETLAALEPWDEAPLVETRPALYLAPGAQILDQVRQTPETVRSLLVVGHNPGLHDFARLLVGEAALTADGHVATRRLAEGYPAGTLTEFLLTRGWAQAGEGAGRLLRFVAPRDLPEQGLQFVAEP